MPKCAAPCDRLIEAYTLTVAFALLYGPARFLLDFLRDPATDPRYAELTFARVPLTAHAHLRCATLTLESV